jgi:hypothetical protein
MFSVLKVRRDQKPGDYGDPGWFQHPPGTVAHEVDAAPAAAPRAAAAPAGGLEVRARKPGAGDHRH